MHKWSSSYKLNFHFNTKQIRLSISTDNQPKQYLE